jgi:hypothetical protein
VAQDSSRNLVFWFLQYVKSGNTSTSTNGVRLAVAHGQAGLAGNSWTYYDFTPALFGLPAGKWFDFPHLQASANDLYFTTNIFNTVGDSFYGALVVRIPLAQLDSGSSINLNFLSVTTYGSIMPVNGAAAEGTRPGRTTMYFASVISSTSLKVITWPESSTSLTINDVTGLASTSFSTYTCPGPDGLDPCTRANARMQTGWITDTELGLMWTSAQNGASRPYPYTRVAILNPATLSVISQPDIFNTTNAWLYPAISVNERGHLAGTLDNMGGVSYPTITAIVRDDFSPNPATSGWEVYTIAASNSGTFGTYGDYNGTMPHEKYPKTWLATGHTQIGGSGNGSSVTHNYWFGRERDTNPAFTVSRTGSGTGTVTSSPAGINCGATCSTTAFTLGNTVTLTATPGSFSTFAGWSGACSGTGSCVVPIDGAKSVTATFTPQTFALTVSKTGTGTGVVASSPAGINCGATCSTSFNGGTSVTLTQTPGVSSTFTGWSGACSGSGSCVLTMSAARSVTAAFGSIVAPGLDYYTVTPCRVLDTRSSGPALVSGVPRVFAVAGLCGIPSDAVAVSMSMTAVAPSSNGFLALFPGNQSVPATSSLNFSTGVDRANNAILSLATNASGTLAAQSFLPAGGQVHLIVDISGYFR